MCVSSTSLIVCMIFMINSSWRFKYISLDGNEWRHDGITAFVESHKTLAETKRQQTNHNPEFKKNNTEQSLNVMQMALRHKERHNSTTQREKNQRVKCDDQSVDKIFNPTKSFAIVMNILFFRLKRLCLYVFSSLFLPILRLFNLRLVAIHIEFIVFAKFIWYGLFHNVCVLSALK